MKTKVKIGLAFGLLSVVALIITAVIYLRYDTSGKEKTGTSGTGTTGTSGTGTTGTSGTGTDGPSGTESDGDPYPVTDGEIETVTDGDPYPVTDVEIETVTDGDPYPVTDGEIETVTDGDPYPVTDGEIETGTRNTSNNLRYNQLYFIENVYAGGTYLDTRGICQDNSLCVSTKHDAIDRDNGSTIWKLKLNEDLLGNPVIKVGDSLFIENQYRDEGFYLETINSSCDSNPRCVSAGKSESNDQLLRWWRLLVPGKRVGEYVELTDTVFIENQFGDQKTYLDTRNGGCQGNTLCVSAKYNMVDRDNGTTLWKFVPVQVPVPVNTLNFF
jgi:hypothetical protein